MDGQNVATNDATGRRADGKLGPSYLSIGMRTCHSLFLHAAKNSSPIIQTLANSIHAMPSLSQSHQAHLDPTVIIAEPIPIDSLTTFTCNVMITFIVVCCVGSTLVGATKAQQHAGDRESLHALLQRSLWNLLQSLIVSTIGIGVLGLIVFLAAILCGASPWIDKRHTILASGYVASLAFGPSLIFDAKQYLEGSTPTNQIKRLLRGPQSSTTVESSASGSVAFNKNRQSLCERIDSCAMYGTFVGLIPISILRILDHGDQAQRWPFPMLLGATIGYFAGSIVGILSSCVILLQERGTRRRSRPGASIFNLITLINLSAVLASFNVGVPSVSAFYTGLSMPLHNARHRSLDPQALPTLYMAPAELTSTTSKYLDAITEVCDGDMPAKEDCGVAISSYLDALSVGVAESDGVVGIGIASYLDAFTAPSTGPGKHSADAVTSYLGDVSSGATSPPTRESIVSYLDTLSKVGSEATSNLFIDRTNAQDRQALSSAVSSNDASPPAQPRPSSYLDAISEVCEPSKAMEPCLEAVTSYLDNLSPNDISEASHSLAKPTTYLDSMPQDSVPSTGGSRAASPSMFRQPSEPQDLALESWYKRHAIATGYVQVRTTQESVGGRGMFWSSPEAARDTQILARIPKRCVLEASSAKAQWPEAMNWHHINDKNLEMMASAMCAYSQTDHAGLDWREWIDTWLGFGGVMPRPLKSYSSEEIQFLATASGSTFAEVSVAIELRYNAMKNDALKLEFPFTDGAKGMTSDIFADMYSVVVSRCAVMGPAWDYAYGIIPMHDMHNHPPPSVESSVELHALGDVRPHIERLEEQVNSLINLSGVADISPPLDDQDILIVARRDIQPGEELYLSYRDASETQGLTSNDRLWLLFQYGFPLVPVE